ncbi:MAG TPA: class I SAM-dependent methyltransferase [Bacillales bacterium]|nr:class I SAM-dependent methyltransferase [Bacillales bacterium]
MKDDLFEYYLSEADAPFSGWDFSYIGDTGRMDMEPLPWSYTSEMLPHLLRADSLLDMGTGGGEFLSMFRQLLPQTTCATEGYEPNVGIARNRLEPLGVQVEQINEDDLLPFADESFNLVINRHESFLPEEIHRVLKPGGTFITQQVGGHDNVELNRWLGANEDFGYADWNLGHACTQQETADFRILKKKKAYPKTRFYDIGAVVYYIKAIPWQIPDFSVEKHRDLLKELHERILQDGFLEVRSDRFLSIAVKQ